MHLEQHDDGWLVGTTPEGRFFVHRLNLNRPPLVAYRRGRLVRHKLSEDLAAALEHVHELERRMEKLTRAIDTVIAEIERD